MTTTSLICGVHISNLKATALKLQSPATFKKTIVNMVHCMRCSQVQLIGGASAATVRSSKSRFGIDICLVHVIHTEHVRQRSSPWL